jgi:hypothetical protein
MYREFLRVIYRIPAAGRTELLNTVRAQFRTAAKIPRKNIAEIDYEFHRAARQLNDLKNANLSGFSTFTPGKGS